jgi:hypothetical protein
MLIWQEISLNTRGGVANVKLQGETSCILRQGLPYDYLNKRMRFKIMGIVPNFRMTLI